MLTEGACCESGALMEVVTLVLYPSLGHLTQSSYGVLFRDILSLALACEHGEHTHQPPQLARS